MATPVHIHYVRSGGFGGLRMRADVDTAAVARSDAASAQRIEDLAERTLAEAAPPPPNPKLRDSFQYDLTIERAGSKRVIHGSEPIQSPALQQLIQVLDSLSSPTR